MSLLFNGGVVSFTNLALLFRVALPVYLVGSLGVGIAAIPSVMKTLSRPREWKAVWFYTASKHLLWLFVVELVLLASRGQRRFWQAVIVAAVILLAVPSSIQCFGTQVSQGLAVLDRSGVEAIAYVDRSCQRGEVVLSGQRLNTLLAAATRCRVPVADIHASVQMSEVELDQRLADYSGFWGSWRKGELRADILAEYGVAYVVADKQADRVGPGALAPPANEAEPGRAHGSSLRPYFENEEFVIYQVL